MKGQRQIQETTAMLLIGGGVLGMLQPSSHCAVWRTGNQSWDAALDWFARHPWLVRVTATMELAGGLMLGGRQFGTTATTGGDGS